MMEHTDNRSRMDKILAYASFVVVGAALLFFGTLLYWLLEPADVYQVKGDTIAVNPTNIKAGGEVILSFSFCKKLDVQGAVTKTFVGDNTEVSARTTWDKLGPTCIKNARTKIPVPDQLSPGEYRVRYIGTYKINPIRTYKEEHYSEPFIVEE